MQLIGAAQGYHWMEPQCSFAQQSQSLPLWNPTYQETTKNGIWLFLNCWQFVIISSHVWGQHFCIFKLILSSS